MTLRVFRCGSLLFAAVLVFSIGTDAKAGDKVRIIMRAFIPSPLAGSTDLLPVPGSPGKFMLQGPLGANGPLGMCFDTDNRAFVSDPVASARITTDFTIEVTDPPVITPTVKSERFRSGVSHRLNCVSGQVDATAQADVSGCTMGQPIRTPTEVQIITGCSAANPLLPAPAIDYGGSFIYNLRKFTLSFEGDVGSFPSFEIYASLNGGMFVQLLAQAPTAGAGPFSLFDLWLHVNTNQIKIPPTKLYNG